MSNKMKSQEEHKLAYLAEAYKQGLTLQVDLIDDGNWIDAEPNQYPDKSISFYPHSWRVKEIDGAIDLQVSAERYLSQFRKEKNT